MKKRQDAYEHPSDHNVGAGEEREKGDAYNYKQPLEGTGEDAQAASGPQGFLGALTVFSLSNDASALGWTDVTGSFDTTGVPVNLSAVVGVEGSASTLDIAEPQRVASQDIALLQQQDRITQASLDLSQGFLFGSAYPAVEDEREALNEEAQIDLPGTLRSLSQGSAGIAAQPSDAGPREGDANLAFTSFTADLAGDALRIGEIDFDRALTITYTQDSAGLISDWILTARFENANSWTLSELNDAVYGSLDSAGFSVNAGGGADTLVGGSGADVLDGGADADLFIAETGFGNDLITGGETGNDEDVIDFSNVSGPVTVTYSADEAGEVTDGADTITFSQVETLILTDQDDSVVGSAGNDAVQGGYGDDVIEGGAGADSVIYDGDLQDFTIVFDSGASRFTITDDRISDGDEGTDTVTGVETFIFNGTSYTRAQIEAYADGSAPTAVSFASGGVLFETLAEGGSIDTAFDPSGTLLGTLQAADASGPGDIHSFTLISDPSGKFEIIGNELRIRSGQEIDFETDTSFDITVRTVDINGSAHNEMMTINVSDYEGSYTVSGVAESVTGTSEEDVITGNTGNDTLSGGQGDDRLTGEDGSDVLSGGDGNDTLIGGSGGDILEGGSGDDELQGGDDEDSFSLQDGFGTDTLIGGEGGNDNDLIDASGLSGAVTVTYSGNEAGTIGDGIDTSSFSQVERLLLSGGADSVAGGNDGVGLDIDGGAGNDTLIGGSGDDVLFGGENNDVLLGNNGNDTIYGGDGDDVIALINGTGDEIAFGGAGDDEIYGSLTANSTIVGGSGDDSLLGFANDNIIRGGDGEDSIFGGGSGERLEGGADSDQFFLVGNFNNDTIVGGETTTTGEDIDAITANIGFTSMSVTFSGDGAGTITNGSSTASFSEIEQISLLRPYDNSVDATFDSTGIRVFTSAGDDTVIGGSGDDSIVTGGDDDRISAGGGDDTLSGGSGDDTLIGGDGSDLFLVASSISDADDIDGGAGGGWVDEIALVGMGAGGVAQTAADTFDGDGWTLVMDGGHSVTSINSGVLELSSDASGVINFDDGGSVTFADIDRVTW